MHEKIYKSLKQAGLPTDFAIENFPSNDSLNVSYHSLPDGRVLRIDWPDTPATYEIVSVENLLKKIDFTPKTYESIKEKLEKMSEAELKQQIIEVLSHIIFTNPYIEAE